VEAKYILTTQPTKWCGWNGKKYSGSSAA